MLKALDVNRFYWYSIFSIIFEAIFSKVFAILSFTILIVDDDAMVRNLMVRTLVRENYRVWEADSSAEALRVSDEFKGSLDLLITDHTLKTMTGRQVADHIRQSRPSMKVLHISGYPLETLAGEGGLISGAEFLGKPFSLTDLNQKVKRILARPSGGLFEP